MSQEKTYPVGINLVGSMVASLHCQGMKEPRGLDWLQDSWQQPRFFWEGLLTGHDSQTPGQRKSMAFQHYDFFHDLALRFERLASPAILRLDNNGAWTALGHAELARRAARLAERWKQQGVQSGQIVALILAPGAAMLTALLAAFRLGLVVSLLPPQGRFLLRRRLAALQPDCLVIDPLHSSLVGANPSLVLDLEDSTNPTRPDMSATSAIYPSGATVALLFNPCCPDPLVTHPVSADALYLGAVRDGLLSLGLRPGKRYTAPGFDILETQPCLLLAGLINGATWVDLDLSQLADSPERLGDHPLAVLGISRQFRDFLLQRPFSLAGITEHWFRHPGETCDLAPWQRCVDELDLADATMANLAWNAALGGCYLCSPKRSGMIHNTVLPAAGCPWQLGQLPDGTVPAVSTSGLLTISFPTGTEGGGDTAKEAQAPPPGRVAPAIVSRQGEQYFFSRAPHCGKNGLYYPIQEALDIATRTLVGLAAGLGCALLGVPASGIEDDPRQVLLVFTAAVTDEKKMDPSRITDLLQQALRRELGPAFVLDQVVLLPLHPRLDDAGDVDNQWCAEQYLTGRLQRKAQNPLFRQLARVQAMQNVKA